MPPFHFSSRFAWESRENPLALLRERLRRENAEVIDLTVTNPTQCGLAWEPRELAACLAAPGSERYDPQPRGTAEARAAVVRSAARRCATPPPAEQLHLTASTSEAYAYLFKLLADPGDDVLVPSPSYPLFEFLAGMEQLRALPYRFRHAPEEGWRLDETSLEAAATARTRAVVAVHPGNPAGAYLRERELRTLARFCAERGLALICDEVFYEYPLTGAPLPPSSLALEAETLVFTLDGISKSLALPQLKLGWIVSRGPEPALGEALARLDLVADTYLSAATPVQRALPSLLERGAGPRRRVLERCSANLAALREHCGARRQLELLAPEGGWSAVLRVAGATGDAAGRGRSGHAAEELLVLRLLGEHRLHAYPGYFFDIAPSGHLVVSLLAPAEEFREGLRRLDAALNA